VKTILTGIDATNPLEVGGKAKNLRELELADMNVPSWVVIPKTILSTQLPETIDHRTVDTYLKKAEVPEELTDELKQHFGESFASKSYAVRSSAVDEDGSSHSFAGQYESHLHVRFDEIPAKVKSVWQSVNSERVVAYRNENNLPLQFDIAVIVQEMVPAEVSGVAFGINPVSGDLTGKVISAVFGLGEGLVSGELDADNYTVTSVGIISDISNKSYALHYSEEAGKVIKTEITETKKAQAVLTEDQVLEISTILDKLKEKFGKPQDIEFAFYNSELFLLQTRPITTLGISNGEEYILWDNSNIIESYPGVTTPLTFSFIQKMYEHVYRQLAGILGVATKDLVKHSEVFANTLGLVRGRVYYNLLNWYKMLALVPGYTLNAEYLEKMLGIKERFELSDEFQMARGLAKRRIFVMALKILKLHFTLRRSTKKFQNNLDTIINQYKSYDFDSMTPAEIVTKYMYFESTLLNKWKAPQVNDFFAMIWFGILEKMTREHCNNQPNLHNDLLCGSKDIISVEPVHRTFDIVRIINGSGELRQLFIDAPAEEIWQRLVDGEYPAAKNEIDQYLERFGDRCVGELKLESISYLQDPRLYIKVLKSYVNQNIKLNSSSGKLDEELRKTAEYVVAEKLKHKPWQKFKYRYVLKRTRRLVSNRENLRYERTRGFGMVRTMFTALGNKLYQNGLLEAPRDIFYLTLSEIKEQRWQQDAQYILNKVNERKQEFTAYELQDPPKARFHTYGYNFEDRYIYSTEKLEAKKDFLLGTGCCPGKVQAKVQVIHSPDQIKSLNGDILVTSSTDPGWITLFPTAAAIIVERGSLLSHSAIVSREMGIPCIVSVNGLLNSLSSGDEVLMDGSTGEINIIR
jgi:phosphohistidine swiveling domain-containing protein